MSCIGQLQMSLVAGEGSPLTGCFCGVQNPSPQSSPLAKGGEAKSAARCGSSKGTTEITLSCSSQSKKFLDSARNDTKEIRSTF
jgi:hypothetical protein